MDVNLLYFIALCKIVSVKNVHIENKKNVAFGSCNFLLKLDLRLITMFSYHYIYPL